MTDNGFVLLATAAYAIAAPVATAVQATMQTDPFKTAVAEMTIPADEIWTITDIYISTAAGAGAPTVIDPILMFNKNRSKFFSTDPLTALLVTNNSRPTLQKAFSYQGNSILDILAVSTVLNGGAISTATFRVKIRVTPIPQVAQAPLLARMGIR